MHDPDTGNVISAEDIIRTRNRHVYPDRIGFYERAPPATKPAESDVHVRQIFLADGSGKFDTSLSSRRSFKL